MKKKVFWGLICLGGIGFLVGLGIFLYPFLFQLQFQAQVEQTIDTTETQVRESGDLSALRAAMEQYNQTLYQSGQAGLVDQLSYEEPDFLPSAYGCNTDTFGTIEIPRLGIVLPVYNGASEANMAKGAVHLSHTSLPIGGENTNCVIAAHTMYQGVDLFRYLTDLQEGDVIYLHNYWETLTYRVVSTRIILPDEIQTVLIQPGKDLVTLSTCYPFPDHSHRYLVYAEREEISQGVS